ncbi:MAG: hypothetical protein IJC38_09050 [Erysipelotrichaceae bacterium]|nr:hypothetical protein [Erysipelotrichaceae bacterium]
MKQSKQCPKCHSANLVRYSGNDNTSSKSYSNSIALGNPVWELVKINRYICCECGYTEEWIDKKDLEKIRLCKNTKG